MQEKAKIDNSFDLTKITEFNPAIIYGFEAENSLTHPFESLGEVTHVCGQIQDVYYAYLFIQQEILPKIAKSGISSIKPKQLITWLNQIHGLIAATVAKESDVPAGEFSKDQVFSWNHSALVGNFILMKVSDNLPPSKLFQLADAFHLNLKEINIDLEELNDFILLLRKISEDEKIPLPKDQKKYINASSPDIKGMVAIHKLAGLYHADKLNESERMLVGKFVKICTAPSEVPKIMETFAREFLAEWKMCEGSDLDQVVKVAQMAFYNLVQIHPYFNCNKRVGTSLINIILRSYGLPSILLVNPSSSNSNYSQETELLNTNHEYLGKHIKHKIQDVVAKGAYSDKEKMNLVNLRIQFARLINKFIVQFPKFDADSYFRVLKKGLIKKQPVTFDQNKIQLFYLHEVTNAFTDKFNKLLKESKAKIQASPVIQRQYSPQEKTEIVTKLQSLTGFEGWKTYKTNGLSILLELNDFDTCEQLVKKLSSYASGSFDVKQRRNSENNKHVVLIDNIKIENFRKIGSLGGAPNVIPTKVH